MSYRSALLLIPIVAIISSSLTYLALDQNPEFSNRSGVLLNGMKYQGKLENGLLQGRGTLYGTGTEKYSGQFVDGLLQGEGEYLDKAGGHYKGHFRDGMLHGAGTYTYFNGSEYSGMFVNDMSDGQGQLTTTEGYQYKGEFSRNFMHGKGVFDYNGHGVYEGRFEEDNFVEGVATAYDYVMEGKFSDWELEGYGTIVGPDGTKTEGHYSQGQLNGEGTQTLPDGSRYEGEFLQSMKHGKGKSIDAEGNIYTGEFEYDSFHGKGEMVFAQPVDGLDKLSGEWRWGGLENDPRKPRRNYQESVEKLLYSQNHMLRDSIDSLKESNPDKSDLYFLGVAGYSAQDVFLKEIRYLEDFLKPHADKRMLALVNHHDTTEQYPLATRHSFNEALAGIESKMDVEEDILLVYMTSHGSRDEEFSIKMNGLQLPAISSDDLAESFNQSKVKWKIVVISACYSGGFINELADPHTLIITAARDDRKSFGCSDKSEMTYFGRAYFKQALPEQSSFIKAFYKADEYVRDWEDTDFPDAKHSEPQISIGSKIGEKLESWNHQLGG